MLRRIILALVALSLTLASCGRQVTPDRASQLGTLQINFTTQGQLDFTNNVYMIVVNQEGQEPEPFYASQVYNYQNIDFEIIVSSQNGAQPSVTIYPYGSAIGTGNHTIRVQLPPIGYSPQDVVLNTNCNQQGTQFCLTINRAVLVQPPSSVATPTPTPTTCPTGTATSSPSTTPSSSPTASASPGGGSPCGSSTLWAINWWTVSPTTGTIVDAPGLQGPQDKSTFSFLVDVGTSTTCYSFTSVTNCTWTAQGGWPSVSSQSAQIEGGQVINNP